MAPSRTITMEMTQARTGRSMKKRANMLFAPRAHAPGFHALRGNLRRDALRPVSSHREIDYPLEGRDAERRNVGSHAERGNQGLAPILVGRHRHALRLDQNPWSNLLQAVHDHQVIAFQTAID